MPFGYISACDFTAGLLQSVLPNLLEPYVHILTTLAQKRCSAFPFFSTFVFTVVLWISRYVPADQARAVGSVQASVSGSSASSTGSTPEVQPLKTLQLNKTPLRQVADSNSP